MYDNFVALERLAGAVFEEDLEGGAETEDLELAVDLTLLAPHAVHDPRDVAEVHLELLLQLALVDLPGCQEGETQHKHTTHTHTHTHTIHARARG